MEIPTTEPSFSPDAMRQLHSKLDEVIVSYRESERTDDNQAIIKVMATIIADAYKAEESHTESHRIQVDNEISKLLKFHISLFGWKSGQSVSDSQVKEKHFGFKKALYKEIETILPDEEGGTEGIIGEFRKALPKITR